MPRLLLSYVNYSRATAATESENYERENQENIKNFSCGNEKFSHIAKFNCNDCKYVMVELRSIWKVEERDQLNEKHNARHLMNIIACM